MIPPKKLEIKLTPERGETIGRGGYKTAHVDPRDPARVILRAHRPGRGFDSEWTSEVQMLHDLDSWGFPVLQVYDFFVGDDDFTYMIVERHNAGRGDNKVGVGFNANCTEMYNRVTENSVKSVRQIVRAANRSWVYDIGDFQYLWANDGRIIINDPHIHIGRADSQAEWDLEWRGRETMWYSHLRAFVEQVYLEKSGVLPKPQAVTDNHCSNVWCNASTWWIKDGKLLVAEQIKVQRTHEEYEARAMAVIGIPTINYRWVELGNRP